MKVEAGTSRRDRMIIKKTDIQGNQQTEEKRPGLDRKQRKSGNKSRKDIDPKSRKEAADT